MASTSWPVLYFRSPKVNSVLNLLTQYLLQYRTVTIPNVGTIRIVQTPPQLDVADKVITPPGFSAQIKTEEEVPAHQLQYLNTVLNKNTEVVLKDLKEFGDRLADKINGPGFEWNGFGQFNRSTQSFTIAAKGLNTIKAERVIRENPNHQVLVGDRETNSFQLAEERTVSASAPHDRFNLVTIGWIVLLLSIIAIALLFYQGKFKMNVSGSKEPTSYSLQQNSGKL